MSKDEYENETEELLMWQCGSKLWNTLDLYMCMVCYLQFYRPVFEKKTVLYAQFLARAVEFRDVNEANLAQGRGQREWGRGPILYEPLYRNKLSQVIYNLSQLSNS